MKDRILTLERCPDGMLGKCFYQKDMPKGMPSDTPTKRIRHTASSSESSNYVVGGSLVTQLALVNMGCIAVHMANSRTATLREPDWVCFDIDPESGKFADAALRDITYKEALETLGLICFAKTSGSRALHVVCTYADGAPQTRFFLWKKLFAQGLPLLTLKR